MNEQPTFCEIPLLISQPPKKGRPACHTAGGRTTKISIPSLRSGRMEEKKKIHTLLSLTGLMLEFSQVNIRFHFVT